MKKVAYKKISLVCLFFCVFFPFFSESPSIVPQVVSDPRGFLEIVRTSPDTRLCAVSARDPVIMLYDTAAGSLLRVLSSHAGQIKDFCFSPDSRYLFSVSQFLQIEQEGKKEELVTQCRIWDVKTGKAVFSSNSAQYFLDFGNVWKTKNGFAADSSSASVQIGSSYGSSSNSTIMVHLLTGNTSPSSTIPPLASWGDVSRDVSRLYSGTVQPFTGIAWLNDGSGVLAGDDGGGLRIFKAGSSDILRRLTVPGGNSRICSVAVSARTQLVAAGSVNDAGQGRITVWDLSAKDASSDQSIYLVLNTDWEPSKIILSPDGKTLAAGSGDGPLAVYWTTGYPNEKTVTDDFKLKTMMQRFDKKTGKTEPVYEGIQALSFAPNGRRFAVGGATQVPEIWKTSSSIRETKLAGQHEGTITAFAWSADSQSLLSAGGWDGRIVMWDVLTGEPIKRFDAGFTVTSLAWDNTADFFYAGLQDGRIQVWNRQTGMIEKVFTGHTGCVSDLSLSPAGKLASVGTDGTLRFWNKADGQWLACIEQGDKKPWMLFDNNGYWDGSSDCADLVSVVEGLNVWKVDQFAVYSNRPDILAQSWDSSNSSISLFYAWYRKRLHRLGLKESDTYTSYDRPVSSNLRIDAFSEGPEAAYVRLTADISSAGSPLARYQVWVNDVPLFGAAGKPCSGTQFAVSETVQLGYGQNKIELSCTNARGVESSRIFKTIESSVKKETSLYFLGFGVSEYEDPQIKDLQFAAADVKALCTLFESMENDGVKGFSKVHTLIFTDEQVTKQSFIEAKKFLSHAYVDDVLVMFIAGHGIQIMKNDPSAENTQIPVYYYIPYNAHLSDIEGTAVNFDELDNVLQDIAPRRKLFLMDTCQSGELDVTDGSSYSEAAVGRARVIDTVSSRAISVIRSKIANVPKNKNRWIFQDVIRRSGTIVLSSSRGNQSSLEDTSWQQGAFTKAILNGFAARDADRDQNNMISAEELELWVYGEVPRLVKELDPRLEQDPVIDRDNIFAHFEFPIPR